MERAGVGRVLLAWAHAAHGWASPRRKSAGDLSSFSFRSTRPGHRLELIFSRRVDPSSGAEWRGFDTSICQRRIAGTHDFFVRVPVCVLRLFAHSFALRDLSLLSVCKWKKLERRYGYSICRNEMDIGGLDRTVPEGASFGGDRAQRTFLD